MEHRWGERMPIYLPVRLDARPKALAPGCIRNASLSGAYIQTSAQLSPGILLDVELGMALLPGGERPCERAWLVRRDAHGLAVEWCEFAPQAIRALVASALAQDGGSLFRFAPRHGGVPEGIVLPPRAICRPPTNGAPP